MVLKMSGKKGQTVAVDKQVGRDSPKINWSPDFLPKSLQPRGMLNPKT